MPRECDCGSRLPRRAMKDAADIFCCYVCDQCEQTKQERFNPVIFNPSTRYAMTGEEADLKAGLLFDMHPTVQRELYLIDHTTRAICVSHDPIGAGVWLPASIVDYHHKADDDYMVVVTMPAWLASDKDL